MSGEWGWLWWALAGAVLAAAMTTLTKAGLKEVDQATAFAIQSVFTVLVAWIALAVQGGVGGLRDVDRRAWTYLAGGGVLIGLASLCLFQALKRGDASAVVPVDRLSLVFAVAFAALFLKERLTAPVVGGAVLMAAGAVLIAFGKK
jgi:transporter family protein